MDGFEFFRVDWLFFVNGLPRTIRNRGRREGREAHMMALGKGCQFNLVADV